MKAAHAAQKQFAARSLEDRAEIIAIVRRLCVERAEELGKMEFEESQLGRLDHKIEKVRLVEKVLGVEALKTEARSDSTGLFLYRVCALRRHRHGSCPARTACPPWAAMPSASLAGGNTAVFSSHPLTARSVAYAVRMFNREIEKRMGLRNLLCARWSHRRSNR